MADTTVAVVVYIPFISGYYEDSLEILQICLESIINNTRLPFDLIVFDNASCLEVREYLLSLHAAGKIQFLTFSDQNIGKIGAWNYIVGAAPGKYLAYADADVYHFPGWLEPQIEALEIFPNAGMVTGMPLLAPVEKSSSTVDWAEQTEGVGVERGHFISWVDFWRHSGTLGHSEERLRQFYQENPIVRISFKGKQYFASAGHFQFVARKQILQQFFPLSADRPMGQVRQLDDAVNAAGLLRLSTPEWHIQHLGNLLPSDHTEEGIRAFLEASPEHKKDRRTILDWEIVTNILHWLHTKTFDLLYRRHGF